MARLVCGLQAVGSFPNDCCSGTPWRGKVHRVGASLSSCWTWESLFLTETHCPRDYFWHYPPQVPLPKKCSLSTGSPPVQEISLGTTHLLGSYYYLSFYCWYNSYTKSSFGRYFNPFTLRDPLEIIICYSDTFQNNLGIKQKFTKYLKESCWLTSLLQFSFNYFSKNAFVRKIFPKLSGLFWPLWVLMGFKEECSSVNLQLLCNLWIHVLIV